jgi:hypothetical protein
LRLFFAVYGRALQDPQHFAGFLDRVVDDWMSALRDAQGPDTDPAIATRAATLVIATIRGLLLDLLTTGDRVRVQDAAESFLASLEHKAHRTGCPTLVGGDDTPARGLGVWLRDLTRRPQPRSLTLPGEPPHPARSQSDHDATSTLEPMTRDQLSAAVSLSLLTEERCHV